VHEGKRSHLEELPNREPERDWRPGESDTTVAWVGSLLFLSTARSRDVATTTQAHASPSFWNTVGVIKTNADGLLFWCYNEAAHFPDK